ncbi:MAG TPA: hydroxyisourate hydrolase [Sandaracinaceae bacterium LLY-WYZ-13_1]|nr:hydroxyisourate hydrolase [Sandaracinaceae bacterium LLY-WYZ-13_1]
MSDQKSPVTTHVLDTSLGRPAAGVPVRLWKWSGHDLEPMAEGRTDDDGRVTDLLEPGTLEAGIYRISFDTSAYYDAAGVYGFYPSVQIDFRVDDADQHYHVPLLLSPFGYSTYRGS